MLNKKTVATSMECLVKWLVFLTVCPPTPGCIPGFIVNLPKPAGTILIQSSGLLSFVSLTRAFRRFLLA